MITAMKSSFFFSGWLALLLIARAADPLSEALQRGLLAEEARQDLDAAAAAYREAVRLGDAQRLLIATALFRLAETERRQGRTNEALTYYRRLVREHSDATNLVALAERQLAASGLGTSAMWIGSAQFLGDDRADRERTSDEEDREIQRLKRMLANSPDLLNAPQEPDKETPLQTAAKLDQSRVVEFLLQAGADIDATGALGTTALYQAASAGHRKMVNQLLRAGAQVNASGEERVTPLLGAVASERPLVIQDLLAAGASPTIQSGYSKRKAMRVGTKIGDFTTVSPIGLGVILNQPRLVEEMARAGADLQAPAFFAPAPSENQNPLTLAIRRRNWEIADLLLRLGADPNQSSGNLNPVQIAVQAREVPTSLLDRLAAHGARFDVTDAQGNTLLHLAISSQATNAIPWLLAHGAAHDQPNQDGHTPLLLVAGQIGSPNNRDSQAELETQLDALLAAKADVNRTYSSGWSPLHSVILANTNAVTKMLAAGADPNARRRDGRPLLGDVLESVGAVLPGELRVIDTDKNPLDPQAALFVASALLEAGADPNAEWDGHTLLDLAIVGPPELLKLLLDHQADPNRRKRQGQTVLEQVTNLTRRKRQADPNVPVLANTPSLEHLQTVEALLRAAGARDDLPDFQTIKLVRSSIDFTQVVFRQSLTNFPNEFTLLELFAVHYDMVVGPNAAREVGLSIARSGRALPPAAVSTAVAQQGPGDSLRFPDWTRVVLRRPGLGGTNWTEIPIDLESAFTTHDCSNDRALQWGDVVELPERDYLVNERWESPATTARDTWIKCLARKVIITVKGEATPVTLSVTSGGLIQLQNPFTLTGALTQFGLVRGSSDLSRVVVRRRDPATGEMAEATFDCRTAGDGSQVWLRDGDEIVVPEKR